MYTEHLTVCTERLGCSSRRAVSPGEAEIMSMASERMAWAEGMGLSVDEIEALTQIAEESHRRAGDERPTLAPGDVDSWPAALEEAGQHDLATRVREIRD